MFQLNNYKGEKKIKKEVWNVIVLVIMRACFWGMILWIMGADSPQSSFLELIELRQSRKQNEIAVRGDTGNSRRLHSDNQVI